MAHAACRTLVPRPGVEPVPPAVEAQNLNPEPPGGPCWISKYGAHASAETDRPVSYAHSQRKLITFSPFWAGSPVTDALLAPCTHGRRGFQRTEPWEYHQRLRADGPRAPRAGPLTAPLKPLSLQNTNGHPHPVPWSCLGKLKLTVKTVNAKDHREFRIF